MPELKAAIVPVTPFQQNCTILWEEPSKRAVVIDPGGEVPRILEAVTKLGVRVERILLTHGHIDHAGGALALKEALEQAAVAQSGGSSATVPLFAEGSLATVPIEGRGTPAPNSSYVRHLCLAAMRHADLQLQPEVP